MKKLKVLIPIAILLILGPSRRAKEGMKCANNKNWKSLIKPAKLDVQLSDDKSYAKIIAEPLEKGYGLTLGNSLRRILLSSIRGTAVTAIQIDGVLHEFTSIKGVREDVTDIVLNIKSNKLTLTFLKLL